MESDLSWDNARRILRVSSTSVEELDCWSGGLHRDDSWGDFSLYYLAGLMFLAVADMIQPTFV
jgi:hypothetical protein